MHTLHYESYEQTHMGPVIFRQRSQIELSKQPSAGTSCTDISSLSLNMAIGVTEGQTDQREQPAAKADSGGDSTQHQQQHFQPQIVLVDAVSEPEPPLKIKTGAEISQELNLLAVIN